MKAKIEGWLLDRTVGYDGYAHLTIRVLVKRWDTLRIAMGVRYQAHKPRGEGFTGWYGQTIELYHDFDNSSESLAMATGIMKKLEAHGLQAPNLLLETLQNFPWPRMVMDDRTDEKFVPAAQVLGPEWSKWVDDADRNSCYVSCVARDADEARRKLAHEFSRYLTKMQEWMKADMPVRRCEYAPCPVVMSIEHLFSNPWEVSEQKAEVLVS